MISALLNIYMFALLNWTIIMAILVAFLCAYKINESSSLVLDKWLNMRWILLIGDQFDFFCAECKVVMLYGG